MHALRTCLIAISFCVAAAFGRYLIHVCNCRHLEQESLNALECHVSWRSSSEVHPKLVQLILGGGITTSVDYLELSGLKRDTLDANSLAAFRWVTRVDLNYCDLSKGDAACFR